MISHRAFAGRRGPRSAFRRSRSRLVRVAAQFGLSALLGGVLLPAVSLVVARDSASVCCRGRCCCTGDSAARDDRTCLRRGCGCDHGSHALAAEPLGVEALLPCPPPVPAPPPLEARWAPTIEQPIARAQEPVVPPPRQPLPA